MDPVTLIATLNAVLSLGEQLAPQVKALASSGQITPEQQAEVKKRFEAFRASADFSGPEWQIT